jgi:Ribbon-helix-helix protein, copG family
LAPAFRMSLTERKLPMREREQEFAVLAFRCPPELIESLDQLAAFEGISRSDVARRAAIQAVRALSAISRSAGRRSIRRCGQRQSFVGLRTGKIRGECTRPSARAGINSQLIGCRVFYPPMIWHARQCPALIANQPPNCRHDRRAVRQEMLSPPKP